MNSLIPDTSIILRYMNMLCISILYDAKDIPLYLSRAIATFAVLIAASAAL